MKTRLAFVDHSFHRNTHSGDFLRELFSEQYIVQDLWDDGWKKGKSITAQAVNETQADVVFFFQSLPTFSELRKIKPKIIWAPMYDSVPIHNRAYWFELSTIPIKMLTFSSTLHRHLLNNQLDSLFVQYWFNPETLPQVTDYSTIRIFFWQRTDITFQHVKKIIGNTPVEKCIVKLNPDPQFAASRPTAEDIKKYHIQIVESGFTDKTSYLKLLQSCNVFICPRRYEGIGMSFLEAMAMGLVPIALDHPTMNEYIQHSKNGLLWKKLELLSFDNLSTLGTQVHQITTQGYTDWKKQTQLILQFMSEPAQAKRSYQINLLFKNYFLKGLYTLYLVKRRFLGGTY
ncbi:MAG: glycosyltransferase [Patescibacteria group bacterium]|jgi:hypothetical protein